MSAMTVPQIPIIPAGSIVTGPQINQLAYAAAFLMHKPMTRVYDTTGGITLEGGGSVGAHVSNYITVNFNEVNFDVDGAWSSSHHDRLTIQTPGWYKVRYSVNIANNENDPCNAAVVSTSGAGNPSGAGVQSGLYLGSYGYSNSTAYLGAAGIFGLYLYTNDYIQVIAISSANNTSSETGTTGLGGGQVLNPGSSLSIEWISAG